MEREPAPGLVRALDPVPERVQVPDLVPLPPRVRVPGAGHDARGVVVASAAGHQQRCDAKAP